MRRWSASDVAIAALAALALLSCGRTDVEIRDRGTRAVVIGIDGADWKLIDEIASEGGMPHLSALRERGVSGEIETLHEMPLSPVIWTSVATGKSAAEHGVSWFLVDQADGTRVPVRSHNRQVKAIWNILAENGRRPGVVGWWATYPAEAVGDGVVVSDALGFHGFGSTARAGDDGRKTHPPSLFGDVDALVPTLQQITGDFVRRFVHLDEAEYARRMFTPARLSSPDPREPIHLFQQYVVTAEGYTAIAEKLIPSRPWDLFMLYFEQVDSFSHLFMKYAPPKLDWVEEEPFELYRDVVSEWYRYQDELLGRVLAGIDLDETAVFVLSDHGFKSGERRIRSEQTIDVRKAHLDHETHGVFLAAGPHVRRGARIEGASVLDLTPTLLHYLGFPVGKDMDGKVLTALFEPEFMADGPVRYVATYEEGEREESSAPEAYDGDDLERNMERLRALGYIGGAGDRVAASAANGDDEELSPEVLTNRGRIQMASGELDRARDEFTRALALRPDHADALLGIGEIDRRLGRLAEAEYAGKRALQVDPNSTGALAQLAEIERDRGTLDEAVRLFEEALRLDDSRPHLYLGYGDVLQRAGRLEDAERAFRRVLQLDPDSFRAYYNLGVTHANQGRVDEAVLDYERALEVGSEHPDAAKALNNLAAIHLSRGDVEAAVERFIAAVETSPVNLEARFNLASLYLDSDRVAEAVTLLEQAAALDPNHEHVSLALGLAYIRVGRNQDAFRSLLLVRRLYPRNWAAAIALAALYAASGDLQEARGLLDDALDLGGEAAKLEAADYPVLGELR